MNEAALLASFVLWFGGIVASIFLADRQDRSVGAWLLVAALLPLLPSLCVALLPISPTWRTSVIAACLPAVAPLLLAVLPRRRRVDITTRAPVVRQVRSQ